MNAVALGAALVPSALLMWFFHSRDVHPEPAGVLWATFLIGVAAIVPIAIAAEILRSAVKLIHAEDIYLGGAMRAFFVAAIPEEFFKYQVLTRYAMRHREFDEPMDGIVYGVAASLGFATFENIQYVVDGGMEVAFARALTAVPGHAMMGAIMGYYTGQASFRPEKASRLKRLALLCPVMLHGLYDAPLMVIDNAMKSRSGLTGSIQVILLITFAVVLLTEHIWAMRLVMRLRSRQLNEPDVSLGNQWRWTWFRIIFGGVLTTGAGMTLLFIIGLLLEKDGGIGQIHFNGMLVFLAVAVFGVSGAMLFRSGLKAKAVFDINS